MDSTEKQTDFIFAFAELLKQFDATEIQFGIYPSKDESFFNVAGMEITIDTNFAKEVETALTTERTDKKDYIISA